MSAKVWRLSSRGRRPRLDIQTEADTCQTKERRASLKAWSESEIFSISGSFRFSPEDTFSLSIKPRPQSRSRISPDLEVHPFISYKPNYKCSKVSRSSTENSRPLGLLFSNHKWPQRPRRGRYQKSHFDPLFEYIYWLIPYHHLIFIKSGWLSGLKR